MKLEETRMKRLSLLPFVALLLALFPGTLAFAHGGLEHILGTVSAITDHSLTVKTRDGAVQTVEFDSETKFVKGDAAATAKDVQVGSRVAIHAHKDGTSLHAAQVSIGANAAPAPK
jgi:hypothetical protein